MVWLGTVRIVGERLGLAGEVSLVSDWRGKVEQARYVQEGFGRFGQVKAGVAGMASLGREWMVRQAR